MTTDIEDAEMLSVPSQVLQDLIWNCGLAAAGIDKGEDIVGDQCRVLQAYLDSEPTDDAVSVDEFNNVEFVDFSKPV